MNAGGNSYGRSALSDLAAGRNSLVSSGSAEGEQGQGGERSTKISEVRPISKGSSGLLTR